MNKGVTNIIRSIATPLFIKRTSLSPDFELRSKRGDFGSLAQRLGVLSLLCAILSFPLDAVGYMEHHLKCGV